MMGESIGGLLLCLCAYCFLAPRKCHFCNKTIPRKVQGRMCSTECWDKAWGKFS